mmetsp:Transcript_111370/g.295954  ORF Transcript_111370/g.295954 Transcript_111370/m.295954 type:complete len:115 (-) Transcript_111370:97-441(-)
MIPALLLGFGLWGNWYSSKALDEISSIERLRRPISDFWSGIILGAVVGLWVGANYGQQLKQAFSTVDKVTGWLFPGSTEPPAPKRPPDTPSAPFPQHQATLGVQPPVYYQAPQQ